MSEIINFYIDDSGTRHPDKKIGRRAAHGCDYFSLGGVLVNEKDEEEARALHSDFCKNWDIDYPLHSVEIRACSKNFTWLGRLLRPEQLRFYDELYLLLKNVPVVGLACVIDRPGYNDKYHKKYGRDTWSLCRTAFGIVVERACKYVLTKNSKLRVLPERATPTDDIFLEDYYNGLKNDGHPFDSSNSLKYEPLSAGQFHKTLYEFKLKFKSSPMAQLADLYLWPMCMGGYHKSNRPYSRLMKDGKLIDCYLSEEQLAINGIKYSCFESVEVKE